MSGAILFGSVILGLGLWNIADAINNVARAIRGEPLKEKEED